MTDHPQHLDDLLEVWKRDVVPKKFPDLEEWIPEVAPLSPAFWGVMRQIWNGTSWRRHVDPSYLVARARVG